MIFYPWSPYPGLMPAPLRQLPCRPPTWTKPTLTGATTRLANPVRRLPCIPSQGNCTGDAPAQHQRDRSGESEIPPIRVPSDLSAFQPNGFGLEHEPTLLQAEVGLGPRVLPITLLRHVTGRDTPRQLQEVESPSPLCQFAQRAKPLELRYLIHANPTLSSSYGLLARTAHDLSSWNPRHSGPGKASSFAGGHVSPRLTAARNGHYSPRHF